MKEQLEQIWQRVTDELARINTTEQLEKLRVAVLGRKGELTGLLRLLGTLDPSERPGAGQLVNDYRQRIEAAIDTAQNKLQALETSKKLERESIDVTMPGDPVPMGSLHPLSLVAEELRNIFISMGFSVKEGPEIEYDRYNFEMLNIPKDHPARDTQDTFYVNDSVVLRTHTSPVQVRTMLSQGVPVRMICPGRVYRSDDVDATHSPVFHQCEGLVVDKGITLGHLKGILDHFLKKLYGPETKTRFRPGYFPFTEPSAEVDVSCSACGGKGCRICKGSGWIEVLGSGMVHPNVLRMCGIDPEVYSGFAFGMGIDRLANLKYNITDIRLLFDGDVRFLSQF